MPPTSRKTKIVLLGPPASGKGTQGALIEERCGIPPFSTGAALREEMVQGTALGVEAEKHLSQGRLLPDDLMLQVVSHWLEGHREAFAFDGFPRTVPQAEALDAMLARWGTELDCVLCLKVPEEALENRVLSRVQCASCRGIFRRGESIAEGETACPACGGAVSRREDDTAETLRLRLVEYREKTAPLIPYYDKAKKLVWINGDQSSDMVFREIAAVLGSASRR